MHEVNKKDITLDEKMSGMPGLSSKYEDGDLIFEYRLEIGLPDYFHFLYFI